MTDWEHPGVRWFGEPWPSADSRATICEDDALRIDVPWEYACIVCNGTFWRQPQGVQVPLYDGTPTIAWLNYHIECFIGVGLGRLGIGGAPSS